MVRLPTLVLFGAVIVVSSATHASESAPSLGSQTDSGCLSGVHFQEKVGVNPYIEISCAPSEGVYQAAQTVWLEHNYPNYELVGRAYYSPTPGPPKPERLYTVYSIRAPDGRRLEVWFKRSATCNTRATSL